MKILLLTAEDSDSTLIWPSSHGRSSTALLLWFLWLWFLLSFFFVCLLVCWFVYLFAASPRAASSATRFQLTRFTPDFSTLAPTTIRLQNVHYLFASLSVELLLVEWRNSVAIESTMQIAFSTLRVKTFASIEILSTIRLQLVIQSIGYDAGESVIGLPLTP